MERESAKDRHLSYQAALTSPYDRPIDRTLRVANFIKGMRKSRRKLYWMIMLPALAGVIWFFYHQLQALEKLSSAK